MAFRCCTFTGLLNTLGLAEVRAIHEYLSSNTAALARQPTNLNQLAESVNLHRKLLDEKKKFAARFDPVRHA
jgi:hypothetical protein